MHNEKDDRNFPAIRLADAANIASPTELHRHKLKELSKRLDQFHGFTKGQFVKWKPGLKNRKFPDYGEPAIVTAVLHDDFLEFRLDSRRFEPFDC